MRFEFTAPNRILFGPGVVDELGSIAVQYGRRALLVTSAAGDSGPTILDMLTERGIQITEQLERARITALVFPITGEPTIEHALQGVERARDAECSLVIGIGGGSALDVGKAVSALLTNPGHPLDYLEVIGEGKPITQRSAPYIALPTTAGTGAEVTRNAVLKSTAQRVKVSMRSALIIPHVALVDPQLTHGMPPDVTASTGLDALTQVLEPFVSRRANPLTDALCREGITRTAASLQRAFENGEDAVAREDMSLVSLFGGLALANAGLGAAHGFAGPLGGMYPAPHGAVCAALLPWVMEVNVRALQERAPHDPALERYQEIAARLTGDAHASIGAGIAWIKELTQKLNVPGLAAYGIARDDLPDIVQKSAASSSMRGNPIALTSEEMQEILLAAF
jgi:alcohol dehydrogenase class IV